MFSSFFFSTTSFVFPCPPPLYPLLILPGSRPLYQHYFFCRWPKRLLTSAFPHVIFKHTCFHALKVGPIWTCNHIGVPYIPCWRISDLQAPGRSILSSKKILSGGGGGGCTQHFLSALALGAVAATTSISKLVSLWTCMCHRNARPATKLCAKDHTSIQLNVAKIDKVTVRGNGQFKTYAICGAICRMGESNDFILWLAKTYGIVSKNFWLKRMMDVGYLS